MNPVSQDVKDMLIAESVLSLTFATNLFVGREPADPKNCTTVFDTPGSPAQLTMQQGEDYYYDAFSVRVRNINYLTGIGLAIDIMVALHGRAHETWNTTYYSAITCLNGPFLLDWTENGLARFVVNFNAQRR